jgi:hypothetical protein
MVGASGVAAQTNPDSGKPTSHKAVKSPTPSDEPSAGYAVSVEPDKSATAMADPGSAAEFGSPSATGSPSLPMPMTVPPIQRTAKRPGWVKKAPPAPENPAPPPR